MPERTETTLREASESDGSNPCSARTGWAALLGDSTSLIHLFLPLNSEANNSAHCQISRL